MEGPLRASFALCKRSTLQQGADSAMVTDALERMLHTEPVKTGRSACNDDQCRGNSEVIGHLAEPQTHFEC